MAGRRRSAVVAAGAHGELAQALRRLRDQRGMTLRQVATRSGYSLATLSMAESGRRFPSWEVLSAFVQSCGADPGEWRLLWQSAAQSVAEARSGRAEGLDEPAEALGEPAEALGERAQARGEPGTGAYAGPAAAHPWPDGPRRLLRFAGPKATAAFASCVLIAAAAVWAAIAHLSARPPHVHRPQFRPPAVQAPARGQTAGTAASRSPASARFAVAPVSCGALVFGADGAAGPVTCPDGRPNLAADRWYRPLRPRVLGLGPAATPVQVDAAICADLATRRFTFPIEARAVELAQAEQGWRFGVDPVSAVGPGLCPNPSPRHTS